MLKSCAVQANNEVQRRVGTEVVMRGFSLDVCIHGRKVKTYRHEDGEFYIEGRKGSEYTLKVHNNTNRRSVAVISVDGLSVMDGNMASRKGAGYVLDAHSVTEVPGWRLDNSQVARFKFGTVPQSFAGRKKKAANVGVIGCVVFFEKEIKHHFMGNILRGGGARGMALDPCQYSGGMVEMSSSTFGDHQTKSQSNIGTEFGRRDDHRVSQVSFEAEDHEADELVVRYDDREGLEARGIRVGQAKVQVAQPFPKDEIGCKPPSGWRGR